VGRKAALRYGPENSLKKDIRSQQTKRKHSIRRKLKMTMSDPIADMLTRIRNANTAKHDTVDVPASKMKVAIADILVNEGYIVKYDLIDEGSFKTIRITLKYGADKNEKVITGLKRISKPGLRVYAGKEDLPKVLGGLGTAIISTNQGVVTDKEARKLGVGGEVLCFVW
jgi:small subunit ribosomal protein S8